ncbi:MAG: hypothetical protein ACXWT0_00190 [Methylobacter sp.]
MIAIQSTIVGYSGKPRTLFSAYNAETRILVISVDADYRKERRDGCMVITNDDSIQRDMLFTEEDLQASIEAFFMLQGGVATDGKSARLVFSDKAMRGNPAQSIEKDGMDTSGQRFRISENITSAQIAVLAACWYAEKRLNVVNDVLDMADRLLDLDHQLSLGGVVTI